MNKVLLLISFILLFSCSSNKRATVNQEQMIIPAKFSQYNQELSPLGDIIILHKELKTDKQHPSTILQYAVFSKTKNAIIFEDQLVNGKYEWLSDNILKVSYTPGIIKENTPDTGNVYYINMKTEEKTYNHSPIEQP